MKTKILYTVLLAVCMSMSTMKAQDVVITYETLNGLNGTNSLRVYMQSTSPSQVEVGAVNFSFAHIGTCLDFEPVHSVFSNAWTDFLEKEAVKSNLNLSYENHSYDNRLQYGNAEPGLPTTDMVTIPGSGDSKLLVLELSFKGACGNAIYMEDQSENPVNQLGAGNFRTIPYVIERDNPTATPVQWISFGATPIDRRSAQLVWETKAETGSDYFAIEKSFDSNFFQTATLDRVKGAGTTSENRFYQHTDATEMADVVYYRLKHVDFSGAFTYSNTVEVNFGEMGEIALGLDVFPNPVFEKANLKIAGLESDKLQIQVTDLKGAVLLTQTTELDEKGAQELSLDFEGFANGIYNVHVFSTNANGQRNTLQVVKQ